MLAQDTAGRIRAIFLHDGSAVTIFDFVILLGWPVSTFDAAIKWRVVTLEDSPSDIPRVSHAQLLLHAREQWSHAEIVEALGRDAHRFLAPSAASSIAAAGASYVHDRPPVVTRHTSPAHLAAAGVLGCAPFTPRPAAVDDDPNRGIHTINFDEMFGPRPPHVPFTQPPPAARRRELRAMRRNASIAEVPLPAARRRRPDGIREATFTATETEYHKVVPFLRLRGLWLARLGFKPKTRIYIAAEQGRLVITAADPATAAADPAASSAPYAARRRQLVAVPPIVAARQRGRAARRV
ncbi:MAG: Toxin SymE, type toxin-antitoxin system [Acidobacteriota bacterium]|nr:Toxin SymE, type toxin-antitoxin system [Acidobacteriota bacterium]